jgi:Tfp pilus assembly protein PilO
MKGLTPIILILTCVGVGFFYTYPEYQKMQAQMAESAQYDEVILKSSELKNLKSSLADTLASFSPADLERISKLLPEKVDTARFILDVNGIASRYGIEIKDIKTSEAPKTSDPSKNPNEKPYQTSTLAFGFQTPYETMISFVKDLEKSLRMVDVVNISIKPNPNALSINDYTITLQAYWLNKK